MNLPMSLEEVFNRLALVSREVISDHVDLFATRLIGDDVDEECYELGRRVACRGLAQHLTGLGIEGRVSGERAVAVILKAMSLGSSWGERQHGVLAIERLDGSLLIDAEHRRVLRRMQIQPNDFGSFGLRVRIVRGYIALKPMRSQRMLAPYPRHHHVTDVQLGSEFARSPVRRAIAGFPLYAPLQNARLQRRRERGRWRAPLKLSHF